MAIDPHVDHKALSRADKLFKKKLTAPPLKPLLNRIKGLNSIMEDLKNRLQELRRMRRMFDSLEGKPGPQ